LILLVATIGTAVPEREPAEPDSAPPSPPGALEILHGPLSSSERETLQRIAWRTLVGRLEGHPIENRDLQILNMTPRLQRERGCFVTLKLGGETRGMQGEIEPSRPLYQQVIAFTRRAATRDQRFPPLTKADLASTEIEIAVIGSRRPVEDPGAIDLEHHGIFLEKWGRRSLFLPEVVASLEGTAAETLEALCRLAALPEGAWRRGARIEVFEAEVFSGRQRSVLFLEDLEDEPEGQPEPEPRNDLEPRDEADQRRGPTPTGPMGESEGAPEVRRPSAGQRPAE